MDGVGRIVKETDFSPSRVDPQESGPLLRSLTGSGSVEGMDNSISSIG